MLFWKISWFHKTFYHTSHKLCSVQSIFEGISFLGQFKPYYTWAIYVSISLFLHFSISPFLQTLIWMCGRFYSRLVCPNAVVHYYYTIYYILYYIIYLVYLKSPAGPWSPSRRGSRRWWPWWPGASGPGPSTWPGLAAGSSGNYGFQMLAFDPKHTGGAPVSAGGHQYRRWLACSLGSIGAGGSLVEASSGLFEATAPARGHLPLLGQNVSALN